MRNLIDTLTAMREFFPAQERDGIDKLVKRFLYKAPEQMVDCWQEAQHWVFVTLGVPPKPPMMLTEGERWKADALAVWAQRTVVDMEVSGLFQYAKETSAAPAAEE